MKIVHVQSYFAPGLGYQENCLPAAQARLGHEVALITADRYHPFPNYDQTMKPRLGERIVGPGRETVDGVEIVRLKCTWEREGHWWMYLSGLADEVARQQPDVVHAHGVIKITSLQFYLANLRRGVPFVVDEHSNYFNLHPYTWKKKLFYRTFKHVFLPVLLRGMHRALPMSHEVRTLIANELGIPEARSTLSFLGADPERFRRDEAAGRAVRKELDIPDGAVVVVNAGKITRVKDNHVLLRALGRVAREEPRAFLLMIGNAPEPYRGELESLIDSEGLRDRVRWIDFAKNEDLPGYYSAADIGVWPGDWSATVIEAASCGVALVLPDKEFARYSLMNENGLTFERGDSGQLANAFLKLLGDDDLREAMGRRSRELIERELNWDAIARGTIEVYEEAVRASKGEGGRGA